MISKLVINNFLSYSHLEIDFSKNGLYIIMGNNGQGKSTIFEALYWALYNKTLRDAKFDEVVNKLTGKDCYVSVYLSMGDKNIEVTRYRKHTKYSNNVVLKVNNEDVSTHSTQSIQQQIENILGLDDISFVNTVMFGGGLAKLFSMMSDSEQKKMFEYLAGLSEFDMAQQRSKEKLAELSQQQRQIEIEIQGIVNMLEQLNQDIETAQQHSQKFEEEREQEIEHLTNRLQDYKQKYDSYQSDIVEYKKLIEEESDELLKLTTEKEANVCSCCGQPLPFDKDNLIQEFIERIQQYKVYLESAKLQTKQLESEIYNILQNMEVVQAKENNMASLVNKMNQDTAGYIKQLHNLESEKSALSDELAIYEFWMNGFGNSGLKSYKIDSLLPKLENDTNYYLSKFFDGEFQISLNSQTKLKSGETRNKMDVKIYNTNLLTGIKNVSSGEKRSIDLSVLWALQNIARAKANWINVEFYDEVFDTLDEDNKEIVLAILRERSKSRGVWVITHSVDFKAVEADNVFLITKSKFSDMRCINGG